MQGLLVTDSATLAHLAHRAAVSYGATKAQRSMHLPFHDNVIPSVEQFADAFTRLGLNAIKLTPA